MLTGIHNNLFWPQTSLNQFVGREKHSGFFAESDIAKIYHQKLSLSRQTNWYQRLLGSHKSNSFFSLHLLPWQPTSFQSQRFRKNVWIWKFLSSAIYPLFSCSTLHCGKRLNFSNNLMKNFSLRNVLSWFSICQRYQKDQHFSQRTDLFTKHRDSTTKFYQNYSPKKRSLKRSNANLLGSESVVQN